MQSSEGEDCSMLALYPYPFSLNLSGSHSLVYGFTSSIEILCSPPHALFGYTYTTQSVLRISFRVCTPPKKLAQRFRHMVPSIVLNNSCTQPLFMNVEVMNCFSRHPPKRRSIQQSHAPDGNLFSSSRTAANSSSI